MKPKLLFASQGKAVAELQSKLNFVLPDKLPALVVDGLFGEKTHRRVKDFQVRNALVADGIVGAKTWAALDGTKPPPGAPKAPAPSPGPLVHKVNQAPVMNGAFVRCSCGQAPSALSISPANRTATIRDCRPMLNIMPFSLCQSLANPTVAAVTAAAQGALAPQPCFPVVVSMWSPASPVQLVPPDQLPAIAVGSVVMCAWGGEITIIS